MRVLMYCFLLRFQLECHIILLKNQISKKFFYDYFAAEQCSHGGLNMVWVFPAFARF